MRLVIVAIGNDKPQPFRANHRAVLDVEDAWKQLDRFPLLPSGHMTPAANLALAERLAGKLENEAAPSNHSDR